MVYKRFWLQCVVRVLALAGLMLLTVLLFTFGSFVAASILALFTAAQVAGLITFVNKTNRELSRFFRSIRYSDFSQTFTGGGQGASFTELSRAFSEVMDDFRTARTEKEENHRYLQTVMQHIGIGLISFKQDGTVGLINTAAKRLLQVPHLKNVKALSGYSKKLVGTLLQMKSGEKALIQVIDNDDLLQLSIYATEFKLRDELYTLVSIQDIQSELEEKEIEAWQKLTRVLTHEIMNSITPIASLASTVNELLQETIVPVVPGNGAGNGTTPAETLEDVRSAVRTIEKRSQNLLTFVNAYRSLTRIPTPDFRILPVADLFGTVEQLLGPQLEAKHIRFSMRIEPERLDVTADPNLIEQVLINLVKNAAEVLEGIPDAEIRLTAYLDERGRTTLQVIDNGPGIVEEAIDKIFIPFYTTKKEGSGIGLSLSRQIMRQHGGTLSVFSEPDTMTIFTLRF